MKRPVSRLLAVLLAAVAAALGASAQQLGYEANISDFTVPLQSGFYGGSGSVVGDVPDTAHSWSHLIVGRHTNTGNNHQLQIGASYATNDRLFFRKIAASGAQNPGWVELATRGGNTFSGSQTVNGNLSSNGFYTHTGVIYIKPQNSSNEGGHLQFKRATSSQENWNIDHYNGHLRVYMSNGVSSHYFHANGNVGIGTSSPDYKLDVNGAIRAKEIFVETGWADFVFEEDYQLPSLEEVRSHIAHKGHLPGVPSGAEVRANGLEIGQAQTLMMQKIEELTLYVLESSDALAEVRAENAALRSRLADLESRLGSD